MKAFFDTSALIPVFLEDHEHHKTSMVVFLRAHRTHSVCAAHSLAEVFSTLTRLPGRVRLGADQAWLVLENLRERLSVVALTGDEYFAALRHAARAGIIGGAIYDLILARCALKAGAEIIYTWNVRHFQQFGPDIAARLRIPAS